MNLDIGEATSMDFNYRDPPKNKNWKLNILMSNKTSAVCKFHAEVNHLKVNAMRKVIGGGVSNS